MQPIAIFTVANITYLYLTDSPPAPNKDVSVDAVNKLTICIFRFYTYFSFVALTLFGLQCFDAVGWVAGRASGL